MYYEHRVKHKIHYASLEEVNNKKIYDKQFTTVNTHKNVELLKLYWKETTILFLLNQVGIYYGQMFNKS